MEETVRQETTNTTVDKTFTQAELNAIVADRLSREREKYTGFEEFKAKAAKYDAAEEAAKSDLQKAQEQAEQYKAQAEAFQREIATRDARAKVAAETGVPVTLLTGDTEDACKKQAESLLAWHGEKPKYPTLNDAGETAKVSGGKTRDQFKDWFDNTITK